MDLPKEPDPKPIPIATGAVPVTTQKWIGIVFLGCIFCFVVIGWAVSRWSGPSKGIMGLHQEKKQVVPDKQPSAYRLNEEREKAYEQGRREASQKWWDLMKGGQSGHSQAQLNPVALTPKQQARQDYEKLLHDAAMTDNMVEGKKSNDARNERTSGLDTSVRDALGSSDYRSRSNEANNPSSDRGMRNADESNLDNARRLMDRKTPIRALAENVLPEGTEIACTLVNQLNGDNTGPVKVQVENDVPFSRIDDIAIPQGSLFLGEAQKVSAQFQQRLAVSFHLLQLGSTAGHIRQISLDKFPGLGIQGDAALRDQVNHHYLSIFGASLAIGALGGLSQIGNGGYGGYGGIDAGTQVRNGISQSMAQSASQILNHFLNQPPTITIRAGHPVTVHLTANLELPSADSNRLRQ